MKPILTQSLSHCGSRINTRLSMHRRAILGVFLTLALALVALPAAADPGKEKKKDNCILVTITGWKDATIVALERWEPSPSPGMWVAVKKKTVRKNDDAQAEFCGLVKGRLYRVKGTTQGFASEWAPFMFQPNENGSMSINIVLLPIPQ